MLRSFDGRLGLGRNTSWEDFLDDLPVALKAARTVLEKICPRFAVTIRSRVQQCLQQCLQRHLALVLPNAEATGEDEAVLKAIESLDSLEWSDWIQLIEQLSDSVQSCLTALRQQRGYEALQTADPISLTFLFFFRFLHFRDCVLRIRVRVHRARLLPDMSLN